MTTEPAAPRVARPPADFLSEKVRSLQPSGIRRFFDMLAEMKDVISLTIGEPDFTAAPAVLACESCGLVSRNALADSDRMSSSMTASPGIAFTDVPPPMRPTWPSAPT